MTIYNKYGPWGSFHGYKYCKGNDNPVIGFDMKVEREQGSKGDDTPPSTTNTVPGVTSTGTSIAREMTTL